MGGGARGQNLVHLQSVIFKPYLDNYTPFTQLLPTRVCFTNAGINNNNL